MLPVWRGCGSEGWRKEASLRGVLFKAIRGFCERGEWTTTSFRRVRFDG